MVAVGVESGAMAKRVAKRQRGVGARRSGAKQRRSGHSSDSKARRNAVTLIVQLRPREGQELLLEAELRALIGPTRKEGGCIQYELYRSVEGPPAYMLHEIWACRDDHARHTKTDHFLRWNARKDALLNLRDATFWTQIA
jgi:quinol monooxygenase YgiN